MPIRVKSGPEERETSPFPVYETDTWSLPVIGQDDSFKDVINKFSAYFTSTIELPSSFEQLRTTAAGDSLRLLVDHLGKTCSNRAIVSALLALRWHYVTAIEHRGLGEARANACEIVAWRILTRLSEREAVDYCLYEIPGNEALDATALVSAAKYAYDEEATELSPLLSSMRTNGTNGAYKRMRSSARRNELMHSVPRLAVISDHGEAPMNLGRSGKDPTQSFKRLNALEIAAIADAKRFLSQYIVQKIITGLWNGDIVFWDSVSATATRKPRYYNPKTADPFSRLRVPKYLKAWEVIFFVGFLALYYSVVVTRDFDSIPLVEIVFYVWLVAFFWDEFQEWADAGIFYLADLWNMFDMAMITIGVIFAALRLVGIAYDKTEVTDTAFDILSLEALLVIPRICSFLSLSPYWGTLIPCLKEMGKDFVKFMILVIIIYLGFLTTFSLIARDKFALGPMTLDITKIFYGNTSIGFSIMHDIDANLGPPLMILFITLSSILLTGSLTGMLSNSFGRVMKQSREEYLYVYSVYVLEASTSTRLTHFLPPMNLVALVFFRPWQVIFPNDDHFRHSRVTALKLTHWPLVVVIQLYEWSLRKVTRYQEPDDWAGFSGGRTRSSSEAPKRPANGHPVPSPRSSGEHQRQPKRHLRHLSDHRVPDRPPSSAGRTLYSYGEVNGSDGHGVSNVELLKRIDKLTEMVASMEEKLSRQVEG